MTATIHVHVAVVLEAEAAAMTGVTKKGLIIHLTQKPMKNVGEHTIGGFRDSCLEVLGNDLEICESVTDQ